MFTNIFDCLFLCQITSIFFKSVIRRENRGIIRRTFGAIVVVDKPRRNESSLRKRVFISQSLVNTYRRWRADKLERILKMIPRRPQCYCSEMLHFDRHLPSCQNEAKCRHFSRVLLLYSNSLGSLASIKYLCTCYPFDNPVKLHISLTLQ